MSNKNLNKLPNETIKLLASTQIITSVSTAVKELVENSLDAESKSIQVKLDNYGLDVIEVKDDGHGISYGNVQRMFLPGHTSKIACFDDLGKLQSYGFRGEALSAIAKMSKVSVTTKTSADTIAMTYVINSDGTPESSKPSHLSKGTIVTVSNLFGNLPVRKQYLSSKKKVSEELKKVEYVVQSLSVIHPEVRINLIHNKCPIWQKNSVRGIKQSFMQVVGLKITSKMEHLNELANNILLDLIVPKKNSDNVENIFTNSSQSFFLYINRRPVVIASLSKIVMEHLFLHFNSLNPSGKYAVCLLSVEVPPNELDVNLEPNKTKVLLKNESEVLRVVDYVLSTYYKQNLMRTESEESAPRDDRMNEESDAGDDDLDDADDDGARGERPQRKRPRENVTDNVISARFKEFSEKNGDWTLEVVGDAADPGISRRNYTPLGLCSQINKENCTLTTHEEETEIAKRVNENGRKIITSIGCNSEKRQLDERDAENDWLGKRSKLESDARAGDDPSTHPVREKPILPSWPIRQVYVPPETEKSRIEEDNPGHVNETDFVGETRDGSDLGNETDATNKFDILKWSRGDFVDGENGKLPSGVVLANPRSHEDGNDEMLKDDVEQFDLSLRSVSSQMGKKDLSAFTKFARIMRPKLIREFPGILFSKVAGLLVDRWKALSSDEKKYYEKLSKAVDSARKDHQENKATANPPPVRSIPCKKKTKESDKAPQRRELLLSTSLDFILRKKERADADPSPDEIRIIGQLQPSGNWLYRKGNEIGHVRHFGLQELILSRRMFSGHSVPRQNVHPNIFIDENALGRDLWSVLVRLELEYDSLSCRYTVVSDVITKNGFKIDLEGNANGFRCGWITEVPSVIPCFGVNELKNILSLYYKNGEFADLASLRTTSVINYITNEAIRIVFQTPRPPDLADLKEWIDTCQLCWNGASPQCLHCKDIFVPIYHMNQDHLKS